MYCKKPGKVAYELVVVTRIHVLERNEKGDFEVRLELANGETLNRILTAVEYGELMQHPPDVIL